MSYQYDDRERRWRRYNERRNQPGWEDRGLDMEEGWEFPDTDQETNWDLERNRRLETGRGRTYGRSREQDWEGEPYSFPYSYTYTEYWYIPGPYTGVGPRDYQRSDERIFEDVCERLSRHGQIDASDVEVHVDDGEVTLTGTVENRRMKRMVEDTLDTIYGVKDIHNELKLRGQRRAWQGGRSFEKQIHEGMEVVDIHGEKVGNVKEVRANYFLVDRVMERDVYVPFDASNAAEGKVRLNVSADKVDDQGWPTSEILVTPDLNRENE
ncbi:MAG: BON domain-containing protein [Chloroflexi bacterium]|nr:MAG: BON domain-containing protein [Chloroflexota bacterium]